MDTTFDDLLANEGLLLLEKERIACDRETSHVQRVSTISRPRDTKVVGDELGALREVVARGSNSCRIGNDLSWASHVTLEATSSLIMNQTSGGADSQGLASSVSSSCHVLDSFHDCFLRDEYEESRESSGIPVLKALT